MPIGKFDCGRPLIICGLFMHVWSHHCNLSMPAAAGEAEQAYRPKLLRNGCYIMLS